MIFKLSDAKLAEQLHAVKIEIARRTRAETADACRIIKGNEMGKRATLIAAAGGHSILYIGPPSCGKTMMRAVALELGLAETFEFHPCPCGFRNDPRRDCTCTVGKCERHIAKTPVADMYVEICPVPGRELEMKLAGTGIDDLKRYLANIGPELKDKSLCEHSQNIMRASVAELGISAGQRDIILGVAHTIARLDQSDRIKTQHLCEAINYRLPNYFKA